MSSMFNMKKDQKNHMQSRHENFRLLATQKAIYHSLKGRRKSNVRLDFGSNPETMRSNSLDMYDGVHADVVYSNRFDESSDLNTTYLGKTTMTRETMVKAEEKFPILGQGYTLGKLLDNTECQILLDLAQANNKYKYVFVPGTLGILPDTYLVPLSHIWV